MSTSAIGSISSLYANNLSTRFDPAKMLDALTQRFVKKSDTDGDGMLSSQELSGLSADAFKALDTNGDGKLNSDEIKAAVQKAMDEIKQAMSSDDPQKAMSALKDTPEGQLMQLMRPDHHRDDGQDQNSQSQVSSIQITINQTIYNIGGSTTQSTAATTGLDVQA